MAAARRGKGIFVAATGQHDGKTTTCLGLVAGLRKRLDKVSYMKPVGQQWVEVDMKGEGKLKVDKDCILFKEYFELADSYKSMNSVLIPRGYTKDYLDNKTEGNAAHLRRLASDYNTLSSSSEAVVIEGTGHAGVGSIIDLNNATVAAHLGAEAVLIGQGGLGSAIDQLTLSRNLFEAAGVKLKGVILNKVQPDKKDMVEKYVRKYVESRWKVPLLGCIPYSKVLGHPTMQDYCMLFKTKLIAGQSLALRRMEHVALVASSVEAFVQQMMHRPNQLYITPSTRTDIIIALVANLRTGGYAEQAGLIITGQYPPQAEKIVAKLQREAIPTILLPNMSAVEVLQRIMGFTSKIQIQNREKIGHAIDIIDQEIDFETLMA
eukprot:Sspe_Gene.83293::Locus_54631_Transcript_8_10_Confidence_0.447_Length_1468::g.83293::m.83293/K06873/K06873; uncharacterized protein